MNLIVWNCRGLGSPQAVHGLASLVKRHNPDVIFLSETKKRSSELEVVRCRLLFDSCFAVDCKGRSGGLALFWRNNMEVELLSYSDFHVDVVITQSSDGYKWRFTGFYGNPDTWKRVESWNLLRNLHTRHDLPWLCAGDFNEILLHEEKLGGARRPDWQIGNFRRVIDDCQLVEIPYDGPQFTWSRSNGDELIYERLDRSLVSASWWQRFPFSKVIHAHSSSSDHLALVIKIADQEEDMIVQGRRFRFENMWTTNKECEKVIESAWDSTCSGSFRGVAGLIESCGEKLFSWHKSTYGDLRKRISTVEKAIAKLFGTHPSGGTARELKELNKQLTELLHNEEILWRQRSKELWLQAGDRNTKYFHEFASRRHKNNKIMKLKDAAGVLRTKQEDFQGIAIEYFSSLFSSIPSQSDVSSLFEAVGERVTMEHRQMLDEPFVADEVKTALFQMHPSKSPGPDGMTACFYQKYWHIVGRDVTNAVLDFLNLGGEIAPINFTNIVLIPKVKDAHEMKDFRPISLCNVLYKIASKVLANRMKKILNEIVNSNQSAFIPGRMIFDNVMVAYESIHAMKNKRTGNTASMALKLDMSKAYDRVEWNYLEKIMRRMGFPDKWVHLVMMCVRTVRYSILINGRSYGDIRPSRGLRQGDPISPYLFLLCAEGLSSLLTSADQNGVIRGFSVARDAPRISHLFFADDSLLFSRATLADCEAILDLLKLYEDASGQKVNIDKSAIYFSNNIDHGLETAIKGRLGVSKSLEGDKYLGLPLLFGRSKISSFNGIQDRIWKRIQGWKGKLLSYAGKSILIQTVLQAIPTYFMNCFKLPKEFIDSLNGMIAGYWWGDDDNRRRIHWVKWQSVCKAKLDGGLGFKDFECFNLALLAKQCWRLQQNQSSLCFRVFKARYFPNTSFLNAGLGHNPSYLWRSLLHGREVLKAGAYWRVGDGSSIDIWRDRWLPNPPSFMATCQVNNPTTMTVATLFEEDSRRWDHGLIDEWFVPIEAAMIKRIPLTQRLCRDTIIWSATMLGQFTVRSAYMVARKLLGFDVDNVHNRRPLWSMLWKADVQPKFKLLIWRLVNGYIPLMNILKRKHMEVVDMCCVCGNNEETMYHAFFNCDYSRKVWAEIGAWVLNLNIIDGIHGGVNWELLFQQAVKEEKLSLVMGVLWGIWKNRNQCFHNLVCDMPKAVAQRALQTISEPIRDSAETLHVVRTSSNWAPPPHGFVKVNVDASRLPLDGLTTVGMVIRDSDGSVHKCAVMRMLYTPSPFHAEVSAIQFGLEEAMEAGFMNIALESDCSVAVSEVNNARPSYSDWGGVIADIQDLMDDFDRCSIRAISRQANRFSHELSKLNCNVGEKLDWWQNLPPAFCNPDLNQ